jgi:hypothetical protein
VSTPVIGREGLFRLVEWAERLRARDAEGGGEPLAGRTRGSSTDDGTDEGHGEGIVGVVSGGEPGRRSEVTEHALGAAGGVGRTGGSGGCRG